MVDEKKLIELLKYIENLWENDRCHIDSKYTELIKETISRTTTEIIEIVKCCAKTDGWISMAERQPEEGQKVLATVEYSTGEREVIVGNYDSHTAIWRKLMKAWMPCPELYREKK